jgi:hypothetical protein
MSSYEDKEVIVISEPAPSGTQDVNVISSVEIEIKNDAGNPVPVTGTFTTTPSGTQDVNVTNTPTVNVGTMPEVEVKNDSGNPVPVSGSVSISNFPATQLVSGTVMVIPSIAARNDTYTSAPMTGVTADVSTIGLSSFALQVTGTGGTPTLWTVVLEGSLDNVTFTTILTSTQALGNGGIIWSGATLSPVLYFRSRVSTLTLNLATSIVAKILGVI